VLDRNEKVCGYGLAYVDPTQAAGEKQLVVANIAAKREVRGHGIAHHIVDRLRWTARVRGLTEMKLAVVPAMGAGPRIAARQGALESSRYATWERDV
jgi:ribosomal protein S18 acetylase RimI-like enzyme